MAVHAPLRVSKVDSAFIPMLVSDWGRGSTRRPHSLQMSIGRMAGHWGVVAAVSWDQLDTPSREGRIFTRIYRSLVAVGTP